MTKRRALEILCNHWGNRRPLTNAVRDEVNGIARSLLDGPFFTLAEVAGLPIYQGVREGTRLIDELGPDQLEPGGAAHDWVRRTCEDMLSVLPEEERKAKLRDEFANGTWSTVPYAPAKFEGGTK